MKTNKQKTQEKTGYAQVSIKTETIAEKQKRGRVASDERRAEYRRELAIEEVEIQQRLATLKPYQPVETGETTIVEDDYQYRKMMREAMEEDDADMFSYNW